MKISKFKHGVQNVTPNETITINEFLTRIQNGYYKDAAERVQNTVNGTRDKEKQKLPYVTPSGIFERRKNDGLKQHSGFICIDIDDLDDVDQVKAQLSEDPYTYAVFESVSGTGLAVLVRINPDQHREAFQGLKEYYKLRYGLEIDEGCKDVSRARFVSYDPELQVNKDADRFTVDTQSDSGSDSEGKSDRDGQDIQPIITGSNGQADTSNTSYGRKALQQELGKLAAATNGNRNNTLNKVSFNLFQLVNQGKLDEDHVINKLQQTAQATGLDKSEIDSTILSAAKSANEKPRNGRSPDDWFGNPTKSKDKEPEFASTDMSASFEKYDNSDYGAAQYLNELIGKDLLFNESLQKWFIWNGKKWMLNQRELVKQKAKKQLNERRKEIPLIQDSNKRKSFKKHVQHSLQKNYLDRILGNLQSEPDIPIISDDLDNYRWLLNVKNGVVDLKKGELIPRKREQLMSKIVNIEYDPKATCDRWMQFLDEIMQGDQKMIDFLQRAVGYTLTGDVSEQCLFFLWGSGNNGKTKFINLLEQLVGEYSRRSRKDLIMKQQYKEKERHTARLRGRRLAIPSEIGEQDRLDEAQIKDLTGGDRLIGRKVFKNPFEFDPTHKLWLYGNHKPDIRGTDKGIWRRIRLIPFTYTVPKHKRDGKLEEKLIKELPGILRWAVEGCLEWQKQGLNPPQKVIDATKKYRKSRDRIRLFLEDCCTESDGEETSFSDMYYAYEQWCNNSGIHSKGKIKFNEELENRGILRGKGKNNKNVWKNISLTDDASKSKRQQLLDSLN